MAPDQVLVDGGCVLSMRDRLVSLGLRMAQARPVPFDIAREIAQVVQSEEFAAAEAAASRLQGGDGR